MSEQAGLSTVGKTPRVTVEPSLNGFYWINNKLYIISDHPNADDNRRHCPGMPEGTLSELEAL